jgi:Regulator of ribonuclease activity B
VNHVSTDGGKRRLVTLQNLLQNHVAVPSKDAGDQIALKVRALGFATSVELDDGDLEWTCYCTKVLVPEYSEVVKIEQQLDSIAKEFGGYADGFGSVGNAEGE